MSKFLKMAVILVSLIVSGCNDNSSGSGFYVKLPDPPIGATVRVGFLSDSVLQLHNSSHEPLEITVSFYSKDESESLCKVFQIDPISSLEIGALEAPWNFESGEHAVVHVKGFKRELHIKLSDDGKKYNTYYQ